MVIGSGQILKARMRPVFKLEEAVHLIVVSICSKHTTSLSRTVRPLLYSQVGRGEIIWVPIDFPFENPEDVHIYVNHNYWLFLHLFMASIHPP